MFWENRGGSCLLYATFLLSAIAFNRSAEATEPSPSLVPQACFAPDTPASVVEAHATRRTWQLLTSLQSESSSRHQFNDGNRWTLTATDGSGLGQGDPITLTWSLVPDGTLINGFNGEPSSPSNLRAFLDSNFGGPAGWMPLLESVFDRWSELAGIQYVYEPADDGASFPTSRGMLGVRGDLRLSGHRIDGNSGVLAYNFFPDLGDMVLDTADSALLSTANNSLVLRNVLSHEHGHGIGISHVCPVDRTKLMEPFLTTVFDGPQHDDIVAANRGYGDRYEDADTPGTATHLGVAPLSTQLSDLSSDDPGEPDYFSFTVGGDSTVTVSVAPIGASYLSGPQTNGSCSQGTLLDTATLQDLSIEILDRDGTTVLASTDANGAGVSETLADVALDNGAGTYFALVHGSGVDNAQLYQLLVDVDDSGTSPQHTLSLTRTGNGQVVSVPAGIDCGTVCSHDWPAGTSIDLDPIADAGSVFTGWSGPADCADGSVTLNADITCHATFSAESTHTLSVTKQGTGSGTVSSMPAGIDCGSACTNDWAAGTVIQLDASANAGSSFSGWSGPPDCSDGVVTLNADITCQASFTADSNPNPTYDLSVGLNGKGSGTVTTTPAGIHCGSTCTHAFSSGTQVELVATPASGSVFKHIRGDSDCRDGTVTMNTDLSCTVNFAKSRRARVKVSGSGGRVTSSPASVDCRDDCYADFEEGLTVTLSPVPDPGWQLHDWRGHPDCLDGQIALDSDRQCHAVFAPTGTSSSLLFEDGFESGTMTWWAASTP